MGRAWASAAAARAPPTHPPVRTPPCAREQFKLVAAAEESGGKLLVVSLSPHKPTRVERRGGGAPLLLRAGESAPLRPGDRVLLLATEPGLGAVEVLGGGEEEGDSSPLQPPAKRSRMEGEGPAAAAAGAAAAPPPVVLILVGLQGSGKSTFCDKLQRRSHIRRWTRVNQDSIAGPGRRGTREQCLAAAREAVRGGAGALIDRTNVDRAQRAHFIQLAREAGVQVCGCVCVRACARCARLPAGRQGRLLAHTTRPPPLLPPSPRAGRSQAHCVALHLPYKLCMDRAAARTDHEGGLQGKSVYAASEAGGRAGRWLGWQA